MWCNFLFVRHQSDLKTLLYKEFYELVWFKEKYRGWYSSTIVFSCWANLTWPLAETKNRTKIIYSHVIFNVFFMFWKENTCGDGSNQFLWGYYLIQSFWYKICLCRCSEQKGRHFYLVAVNNKAIGGRLPLESNWQSRAMFLIIHLKDSQFCVKYSCLLPKSKLHNH